MKNNFLVIAVLVLGMLSFAACGAEDDVRPDSAGDGAGQEAGGKMEREVEEEVGERIKEEARGKNGRGSGEKMEEEIEGKIEEAGKEVEKGGNIYVTIEESGQEYEAEDGTLLLTVKRSIPTVGISANEEGAAAINGYIRSQAATDEEVMLKWAEEAYQDLGKENWRKFGLGIQYFSERADEGAISFRAVSYSDMGGAHPNSASVGLNFSPKTGERLTLADVTLDKEAAVRAIDEFLFNETKKEEYEGQFFEGYEEDIGDILTEDTWYLGGDGLHIIVNEYIISPHAAGIMDFVIPYGKADFLKEEFKK